MRITVAMLIMAAMLAVCGCGSDPARIDASGNAGLTTTDEINFKDWQMAAEKCINSLLESGTLVKADGKKAVIMVSTVKNSTSQHIDVQILTQKITSSILRSGKAITTTAVSGAGAIDKSTKQVRALEDDEMFNQKTVKKQGTAIAPDFSLAGEITQMKTAEGRMRESYFYFHMTLTDLETGLAVWESQDIEVAKQSKKPLIGF
ncbi:MAG TPA: penicillin-binding protein activator LpoB [Lentisphaeria bacterium]|nr:MAG: penicillin-binding protein activator LpoB [Lentisphaerae bacterium GWF2_49_21]HBC87884.1 penicillin-binding protein activator LpoB [Lentisphaeria bacterium]